MQNIMHNDLLLLLYEVFYCQGEVVDRFVLQVLEEVELEVV